MGKFHELFSDHREDAKGELKVTSNLAIHERIESR
jgi:hypothetical protein